MKPEDQAQEFELKEWEARQRRAILPAPVRPAAKWCTGTGCGERIPDERRAAVPGVQFCAECQAWSERKIGGSIGNN